MKCRVCSGTLTPLLWLPNMPARAQHLPQTPDDKGITLEIVQCEGCELVQLTNDPVPYWHSPIRSDVSQDMREFRAANPVLLEDLEHHPEPNTILKGLHSRMEEGAEGSIEVPNFDMVLERNMVTEFMLDHLTYFTAETLRRTLEINGFDVLEVKPVWRDYMLSARVRKRKPLDLSGMGFDGSAIKALIEDKSAAIWGAGHQALATMAMLRLNADKIKYVVDSAPSKQGRYTPVTHIPIVPPHTLETDPVDALIVMCGSYTEEVALQAAKYNVPTMMIL